MTIRVFRDHPDFHRFKKWFQLGPVLLSELHVETYTLSRPAPDPICGSGCEAGDADVEQAISVIHAKHPGCVLVY